MANPQGINQYTKGGSSGGKKPKAAEVLKPGWVRKGSSLVSPTGLVQYAPRKAVSLKIPKTVRRNSKFM